MIAYVSTKTKTTMHPITIKIPVSKPQRLPVVDVFSNGTLRCIKLDNYNIPNKVRIYEFFFNNSEGPTADIRIQELTVLVCIYESRPLSNMYFVIHQ